MMASEKTACECPESTVESGRTASQMRTAPPIPALASLPSTGEAARDMTVSPWGSTRRLA